MTYQIINRHFFRVSKNRLFLSKLLHDFFRDEVCVDLFRCHIIDFFQRKIRSNL